jgi:LytS/YehU family sensor histidine kinase
VSLASIVVRVIAGALVTTAVWYVAYALISFANYGMARVPSFLTLRYALQVIVLIYPEKLVWGALYFGIKFWRDWIIERERAEQAEEEARQAQLQTLRYQLNPHFLFNSLNSLRALIDEDSQQARTVLTELSEFLRYSLVSRNRTDVALREEVEAIRHYLSIEKKRYEEKLEVTIDVQPKADEFPVPCFLIHPLVENAIKYGMQTSTLPLQVWVIGELQNNALHISIINSGRWVDRPPDPSGALHGPGAGLQNVRARLEHAFPNRHTLEKYERDGNVVVALSLHFDRETYHEEETASNHR